MRIFSISTALLAFLAGMISISIVSRLEGIYTDMGVSLPKIAVIFLGSSGLVPGALFFLIALVICIFLAEKSFKAAAIVSGIGFIAILVTSGVMCLVLLAPITESAQNSAPPAEFPDPQQVDAQ